MQEKTKVDKSRPREKLSNSCHDNCILEKRELQIKKWRQFYLRLGFPVLALREKEKRPYWKGWEKISLEECQNREVRQNDNLGIRLDKLVCLDIDSPIHAEPLLKGITLPDTALSYHGEQTIEERKNFKSKAQFFFSLPSGSSLQTMKYEISENGKKITVLELRTGASVQCAVCPSIHPSGELYKWDNPKKLNNLPVIPQSLIDRIREILGKEEQEEAEKELERLPIDPPVPGESWKKKAINAMHGAWRTFYEKWGITKIQPGSNGNLKGFTPGSHKNKAGGFVFRATDGVFFDWYTKKGGNGVTFLEKFIGMPKEDAFKEIAKEAGIEAKDFCKYCGAEIHWENKIPLNPDGTTHKCKKENTLAEKTIKNEEIEAVIKTPEVNLDIEKINSFFKEYWLQFDGQVETSKEYILASLLTEVGALIGNKAKLEIGFGVVANFYTILVGNSTFMRKTSGLDLGTMYIKALSEIRKESYLEKFEAYKEEVRRFETLPKKDKEYASKPIKPQDNSFIYPKECSPEQLLVKMQEKSDGLFIYSEMGNLLARLDSGYMAGFKEKLTEFYDGREDRYDKELKSGEVVQIKGAAPSLIACSTFQWLQNHLSEADLLSGFLARFLFVCRRTYSNLDIAIQPSFRLEEYFLKYHEDISLFEGKLSLSPKAKASYTNWYHNFKKWALDQDELVHSFLGRLLTTCHKIAIVNHVLEFVYWRGDQEKCSRAEIQEKAYTEAYPWIDFFAKNIVSCYGELTQKTNLSEMKVLGTIQKRGETEGDKSKISMSKLCQYTHMTKKELNEVLETLMLKSLVSIQSIKTHTFVLCKAQNVQ
jgi:hypothetical protein